MCVSFIQTVPVSSMDQWICSRLYSTVAQCEQAFQASELHLVTSALRSFWVHSLCDVYLVSSSFRGGAGSENPEQVELWEMLFVSVRSLDVLLFVCGRSA